MSAEERDFCAICLRPIEHEEERRTIRQKNKEFTAHGYCLVRLRRLACNINGMRPAIPTITRPLMLNEFLLVKKPQSDIEVLCCTIFFHQVVKRRKEGLTVHFIEQQLKLSPFKIADVVAALRHGIKVSGYFTLREEKATASYVLTKKGRMVVDRLPQVLD